MDSVRPLNVLRNWIAANSSQAKFAKDVQCSEGYLSELLKGKKSNVSLPLARRMSEATGGDVSVAAIMGLEEIPAVAEGDRCAG